MHKIRKVRTDKNDNYFLKFFSQCMLEKIQELFTLLRSDGLKPTLQSYAACLECLGRKAHLDITIVQKILADMEKDVCDLSKLI